MSLLDKFFKRSLPSSILGQQISSTLPEGMIIPVPLERLFQWIEANGFYSDEPAGRIGYICPIRFLHEERADDGRAGGTEILFRRPLSPEYGYFFRDASAEVRNRFHVFARSGGDGSVVAFWLDPSTETQKIVHVGSGSGSVLQCVLADDAVDFLRLLAVGYDEISFADFSAPPPTEDEFVVAPFPPFQRWVADTFQVEIPSTGSEIVRFPSSMDDDSSPDPFWRWVREVVWASET